MYLGEEDVGVGDEDVVSAVVSAVVFQIELRSLERK